MGQFILLISIAGIYIAALPVGRAAPPLPFVIVANFVCGPPLGPQHPPPPTSEAAIKGLQGMFVSCMGDWVLSGIVDDRGTMTEMQQHKGGFNPQTFQCGVVQARDTFVSENGSTIDIHQSIILDCGTGTSEGHFFIGGGTGDYRFLQGAGVSTGTFRFGPLAGTITIEDVYNGTAHFLR